MCGPSCAGKTYLADYVKYVFKGRVTSIGFDSYCNDYTYLPEDEIKNVNYDCPSAYDGKLAAFHLRELKEGYPIEKPIYEFASHKRSEKTERVFPNDVIIFEGIMTFQYPELLELADLKVFVDAEEHVRFNRRFDRDQRERGRSPESIIFQFNHTVKPMQKLYIDPVKDLADIIIDNSDNNGPLPMANPLIKEIEKIIKNV